MFVVQDLVNAKKEKNTTTSIWYPATFFQGKPILAAAIVVKKCRRCFNVYVNICRVKEYEVITDLI